MKDLFDYGSRIAFYDELPKKGKMVLTIGESGCGKTHFCGTAPSPFVLDFDKGGATLSSLHIPHMVFNWGEKIMDLTRRILLDCRDSKGAFVNHPYETLAIDSYSAFDLMIMNELMTSPKNPTWKVKDPTSSKPEFDHWGAKKAYLVEITSLLQDIAQHMNVIVTTTVRVNDDPLTKRTKGLPEMDGSIRGVLPRFFDYVLYLEDKGDKYVANTRPKGLYIAKSRGKLPELLEDPKFSDLL